MLGLPATGREGQNWPGQDACVHIVPVAGVSGYHANWMHEVATSSTCLLQVFGWATASSTTTLPGGSTTAWAARSPHCTTWTSECPAVAVCYLSGCPAAACPLEPQTSCDFMTTYPAEPGKGCTGQETARQQHGKGAFWPAVLASRFKHSHVRRIDYLRKPF